MCFTIIPEERNQRKCAKLSKNQSSSFLVEHLIFSKSKPVRNSSTFFFFVLIPAIHHFCLQEASIRSFWSHYILRKSSPNFWFIVCVHALFVPRSSFSVSFLESSLPLFLPGIISCSAFSPSVRGEKKKKSTTERNLFYRCCLSRSLKRGRTEDCFLSLRVPPWLLCLPSTSAWPSCLARSSRPSPVLSLQHIVSVWPVLYAD